MRAKPMYGWIGQADFGEFATLLGRPRKFNYRHVLHAAARKCLCGHDLCVDTADADDIILLGGPKVGRT